jgi:hypothetical protein
MGMLSCKMTGCGFITSSTYTSWVVAWAAVRQYRLEGLRIIGIASKYNSLHFDWACRDIAASKAVATAADHCHLNHPPSAARATVRRRCWCGAHAAASHGVDELLLAVCRPRHTPLETVSTAVRDLLLGTTLQMLVLITRSILMSCRRTVLLRSVSYAEHHDKRNVGK